MLQLSGIFNHIFYLIPPVTTSPQHQTRVRYVPSVWPLRILGMRSVLLWLLFKHQAQRVSRKRGHVLYMNYYVSLSSLEKTASLRQGWARGDRTHHRKPKLKVTDSVAA